MPMIYQSDKLTDRIKPGQLYSLCTLALAQGAGTPTPRGRDTMTKEQWREHMAEVGPHSPDLCEHCRARRKTRRANLNRRCREDALRSCGLVKVRGALGGVYWE
jgi:hypothetical protein